MPTIRPALLTDAAEIAALTVQLGYAADATAIDVRLGSLLKHHDDLVIVACLDEKIAGWIQAHASCALESGHRVEIVALVVAARCRRAGVGRALVRRAEDWATEKGAESLVVRSNTLRSGSHHFYPALGFAVSKTQTVYHKPVLPPQPSGEHSP